MGNVSNGNDKSPAIALGLSKYSIIEVPGVFTVDCDQWQLAQVGPAALVGGIHLKSNQARIRQGLLGPSGRNMEHLYGGIRQHPGIARISQYLNHPATGLMLRTGVLKNLELDELARLRIATVAIGDDEMVG